MKIIIGSDHQAGSARSELTESLTGAMDVSIYEDGIFNGNHDGYVVCRRFATLVRTEKVERGILLSRGASRAAMDANKHPGLRAAVCRDRSSAQAAVSEDDINLLVLDACTSTAHTGCSIAGAFIASGRPAAGSQPGMPARALTLVVEYIQTHLDQPLEVAQLASLVAMSSSHFSKLFKLSLGLSPHQFVLRERIDRAKQLLRETDSKIIDVAFQVGFETQAHFTTVFGELVGATPRSFRCRASARGSDAQAPALFLVDRLSLSGIKAQSSISVPEIDAAAAALDPGSFTDTVNYDRRRL